MSNQDKQFLGTHRNKGYSIEDALDLIDDLPSSLKEELGEPGMRALTLMAVKAPGTLFHSYNITRIMPHAFQAPRYQKAVLLHDLGKVVYPEFFEENMDLSKDPKHSHPGAYILRSHTEGGQVLAQKLNLGPLVESAIAEHQGTLNAAFYKDTPDHYRGDIPSSYFTASLMIADKFEAVSSKGLLNEDLAKRILAQCEESGQFANLVNVELFESLVDEVYDNAQGILLKQELTSMNQNERTDLAQDNDELHAALQYHPERSIAHQGVKELGSSLPSADATQKQDSLRRAG